MLYTILSSDLPWYWDKTISLLFGIAQSLLIAFLTFIIVNHTFAKRQKIGASLNKEGVQRVTANNGKLSKNDENILFGRGNNPRPEEIKLCFLSGYGFLKHFEKDLIDVISNGCEVKLMVADPSSSHFYNDYVSGKAVSTQELVDYYTNAYFEERYDDTFLEKEDFMIALGGKRDTSLSREDVAEVFKNFFTEHQVGDSVGQIFKVLKIVDEIRSKVHGNDAGHIRVRFYKDEYRMPLTLAKFDRYKKRPSCTMLWTNITAPIDETSESINMYFNKSDAEDGKFVDKMENYFDYIWNYYDQDRTSEGLMGNDGK